MDYRHSDFKKSLAESQQALRTWPAGEWGWKFRLLTAENLVSTNREKEARALLASIPPPASTDLLARWKLDEGNAITPLDKGQAIALLNDALRLATIARNSGLICLIQWRLGSLTTPYDEAESHYRAALAAATGDPYLVAGSLQNLGHNRLRVERFDEAIPFLLPALDSARSLGAKAFVFTAAGNLGWCYFRLGDADRAVPLLTEAANVAGEVGNRRYQQIWLTDLGVVRQVAGDLDGAATYQQHAAAIAREVDNDAGLAITLTDLAQISAAKNDFVRARQYNQQALDIKRRHPDDLWSLVYCELLAAQMDATDGPSGQAEAEYRSVIQRAAQAPAPDVLWEAHAGLASFYRTAGHARAAEEEYAAAIHTIDREWNALVSDDSKVTFLGKLIGFFQDYVEFLIAQGQTEKALEMVESSRARVLSQRLAQRGVDTSAFQLDRLQRAARASQTVILDYWLAPKRSTVWVIGARPLARVDLQADRDIAPLVARYTESIKHGGDPLSSNDRLSADLYDAVLRPVRQLIPAGANVIIVPDGALHQLDFGTLVAPEPQPHYWIEDSAIATAPSLRVLSDRFKPDSGPPNLLLVGNPVPASPDFPALPNVQNEIAAVAQHFQPDCRRVVTAADAIPASYLAAAPGNFTMIHFAAHATANRDRPMDSAIVLSPKGEEFKLYARDVAAVPLRARVVTMSACKAAGPKAYSGEGLMGFAWAFLQAGAQSVVASLWDVDDATAVPLMGRMYDEIAAGHAPARSLRSAKLALLHSDPQHRRPYFWGALQVFTRRIARD